MLNGFLQPRTSRPLRSNRDECCPIESSRSFVLMHESSAGKASLTYLLEEVQQRAVTTPYKQFSNCSSPHPSPHTLRILRLMGSIWKQKVQDEDQEKQAGQKGFKLL